MIIISEKFLLKWSKISDFIHEIFDCKEYMIINNEKF